MGKYGASLIHEWFSDWHWNKCDRNSYLTDQDRIWIETRKFQVKCVWDLKWKWAFSSGLDNITPSEQIVLKFFEQHGVPAYILIINPTIEPPTFELWRPETNYKTTISENELIKWIDTGLNGKPI